MHWIAAVLFHCTDLFHRLVKYTYSVKFVLTIPPPTRIMTIALQFPILS